MDEVVIAIWSVFIHLSLPCDCVIWIDCKFLNMHSIFGPALDLKMFLFGANFGSKSFRIDLHSLATILSINVQVEIILY